MLVWKQIGKVTTLIITNYYMRPCGLKYNISNKIDWKCACGLTFRTRREFFSHRKHCEKYQSSISNRTTQNFSCGFCDKVINTTKTGYKLHVKHCACNPNRVDAPSKGTYISEDTRAKLKKHAGGYRKNAGRGKKGYYKGLYCMSTWELAWVVYQLDHNQKVEQCKEHFEYMMNGKFHHYTPDFMINGIYYEIKNWHRPDTDFKIEQFPKDKKIVLIEGWEQNKVFVEYTKNKYGDNFDEVLYEKY